VTIFDQFETEATQFYSGSYTDAVLVKGVDSGRYGLRSIEGGFFGGRVEPLLTMNSERAFWVSGGLQSSGKNRTFLSIPCSHEQYEDTRLPHPFDVTVRNGGLPVRINISSSGVFDRTAVMIPASSSAVIIVGSKLAGLGQTVYNQDTNVFEECADLSWQANYPFQFRYRRLPRYDRPTVALQSLQYTRYTSSSPNVDVLTIGISAAASFRTLAGVILRYWDPGPNSAFGTTSDNLGPRIITGSIRFLDQTGSYAYPFDPSVTTWPSIDHTYLVYFGFGDRRYGGLPTGREKTRFQNAFEFERVLSPIVRGYKYGVYCPLPLTTTTKWRRSRYGQYRDMLEQRPLVKYLDVVGVRPDGSLSGTRTVSDAVVTVAFRTGTADAVTASNQQLLNPNDSGVWDAQCRSGRPFSDS
jgi:hypothetical protein